MLVLRLIGESLGFAWRALKSNILRTVLSLLGVTIGIFSIIAVLTLVDSLKTNIVSSLNFLGTNVIYLHKWPWGAGGSSRDWWKDFIRRPNMSYNEYKFLKENLKNSTAISIYAGINNAVVKSGSNSINKIEIYGTSTEYDKLFELDVEYGRYLTDREIEGGRNVVVIGNEIAKALFPKI